MFGHRCDGRSGCGHSTNWTCPCTCDEALDYEEPSASASTPEVPEIDRLKAQIEGMALYVQHDTGCEANDLDYLDNSPCTCGLRSFYSPKGNQP